VRTFLNFFNPLFPFQCVQWKVREGKGKKEVTFLREREKGKCSFYFTTSSVVKGKRGGGINPLILSWGWEKKGNDFLFLSREKGRGGGVFYSKASLGGKGEGEVYFFLTYLSSS